MARRSPMQKTLNKHRLWMTDTHPRLEGLPGLGQVQVLVVLRLVDDQQVDPDVVPRDARVVLPALGQLHLLGDPRGHALLEDGGLSFGDLLHLGRVALAEAHLAPDRLGCVGVGADCALVHPGARERFVDLDPADAHLLALADNKLGEIAEWDEAGVAELLAEADDADRLLAGWTDEEARSLGVGVEALDGDPFASLPTDAPTHEQMTFTLTHEQAQDVRAALDAAKAQGPFVDTGNENSNGNALARVCEAFRG